MKNLSKRELNEIIEEINTNLSEMVNDHEYEYLDQLDYNNEGDCWPDLELSDQDNDYISNNIHQLDDLIEERKERFEEEYENNKYIELAERLVNNLDYELKNGETFELRFNYTKEWSRLRVEVSIDVYNEDCEVIEDLEDIANAKIGFSKTRNLFEEDKFKEIFESKI